MEPSGVNVLTCTQPKIDMSPRPALFDFDSPDNPSSGAVTPDEDKVPLFAHECIQPPPGGFETRVPPNGVPVKSKLSIQETAIDFDDPSLEDFPTERRAILEHFRHSQNRLPEDQTNVEGIPPSPVVGSRPHPDFEHADIPLVSPNLLNTDRSPSLKSIPEDAEEGYRENVLSAFPEGTNLNLTNGEPHNNEIIIEEEESPVQDTGNPTVDVQEVSETPPNYKLEPTEIAPFNDNPTMDGSYMEPEPARLPVAPFILEDDGKVGEQEPLTKEIVTPNDSPNITVQPATPGSSLMTPTTDPFSEPIDTAKSTAIEQENGRTKMISRKQPAPSPERSLTPTSMRSAGKDAKSRNFLKAFWRVVFVEWIGGFIMRLCGGDRQKA